MIPRAFLAPLAVLVLAAAPVVQAQESPEEVAGATTVDAATAKALLDRGAKFIDVRGDRYWRIGHIPGAASLDAITGLNETSLQEVAGVDDEIVFYCSGPG